METGNKVNLGMKLEFCHILGFCRNPVADFESVFVALIEM